MAHIIFNCFNCLKDIVTNKAHFEMTRIKNSNVLAAFCDEKCVAAHLGRSKKINGITNLKEGDNDTNN